jgi:hypothetical protein
VPEQIVLLGGAAFSKASRNFDMTSACSCKFELSTEASLS